MYVPLSLTMVKENIAVLMFLQIKVHSFPNKREENKTNTLLWAACKIL